MAIDLLSSRWNYTRFNNLFYSRLNNEKSAVLDFGMNNTSMIYISMNKSRSSTQN